MKKKLLPFVLGVAALSCAATAFAACGDEEKASYIVTFNANGGTFADSETTASSYVVENTVAKQPELPEREGYALLGWATDEDGEELWDFRAYSVYENVTLYAVWVKTYTVTLNANGGNISVDGRAETSVSYTAYSDSTVKIGYDITKSGAILTGWTTDAAGKKPWDIDGDEVTGNVTLYAVWKNKFEVIFNAGDDAAFADGKSSLTVSVAEGEAVGETEIPEREGYTLIGWTKNGIAWSLDEPVTSDVTVYAVWQLKDDAQLPPLTVTRSGNTFRLNDVKGAEGYSVIVTHLNEDTGEQEIYREKLTSSSWTFPEEFPEKEITLTKGDAYAITFIAQGDGIKTLSSTASIYLSYMKLDRITDFSFNTTTGELRWGAVANADLYYVTVDGDDDHTLSVSNNYFSLKGYSVGTHYISVVPYSYYGYEQPSASSTNVNNKILPAPQNLTTAVVAGAMRLSWDEVDGADSYLVNIGGTVVTAENAYYDFEDDTPFTEGTARVTVQAFNSDGFYLASDKSTEKQVTFYYAVKIRRNENYSLDYTVKHTDGNMFVPNAKTVNLSESGRTTRNTVTPTAGLRYTYAQKSSDKVFRGWYTSSSGGTIYDFTQPVTSSFTLYAQYYTHGSSYSNVNFYVDGYTSADKTFSTNAVSSARRYYFSVLTDGKFSLNLTAQSTFNTQKVTLYNVTQEKSEYSNKSFSGGTTQKCAFTANAGDVFYFEVSSSGSSSSCSLKIYLDGAVKPDDGGKAVGYTTASKNTVTEISNSSPLLVSYGTEIVLTAADRDGETFTGWYDDDDVCVSTEKTYTVTVNKNVTLHAKYE